MKKVDETMLRLAVGPIKMIVCYAQVDINR